MLRSIATIVAAIQISQPSVTEEQASAYATALQQRAAEHDFDPLTGVSIIFHESGFDPGVVSKNGEDYGLAQIRARYVEACKADRDPVKNPTPSCRRVKAMLLDPVENIRVMAELITKNRNFCREKVRSARFERWLASYQGRNHPKRNQWCKPGEGTWKVVRYRQWLIKQLARQGQLKGAR